MHILCFIYTLGGGGFKKMVHTPGCEFSGRPLVRGVWKCWWAIGRPFNGHPPGEWK